VHEADSRTTAIHLAGELKKRLEAGTDGTGN
jgi:predicted DNA-binding protein